jgi:hypothetical protein
MVGFICYGVTCVRSHALPGLFAPPSFASTTALSHASLLPPLLAQALPVKHLIRDHHHLPHSISRYLFEVRTSSLLSPCLPFWPLLPAFVLVTKWRVHCTSVRALCVEKEQSLFALCSRPLSFCVVVPIQGPVHASSPTLFSSSLPRSPSLRQGRPMHKA